MGFIDWKKGKFSNGGSAEVQDGDIAVNILLTSDIHTTDVKTIDASGATMVVLAGDIMGAGMDSDDAGERFVREELVPWFVANKNREIIVTAGNHDKYLFRLWKAGKKPDFPKNVHYLIDEKETVNGITFYGIPWCLKERDGRFETDEEGMKERLKTLPLGVDVLIAHQPPYIAGETIDFNEHVHEGSKELTEEIILKRPRYVICGHVHSGSKDAIKFNDGRTTIINVARVNHDRSVESCKPRILRFERKR